jgi:hypothetical protein
MLTSDGDGMRDGGRPISAPRRSAQTAPARCQCAAASVPGEGDSAKQPRTNDFVQSNNSAMELYPATAAAMQAPEHGLAARSTESGWHARISSSQACKDLQTVQRPAKDPMQDTHLEPGRAEIRTLDPCSYRLELPSGAAVDRGDHYPNALIGFLPELFDTAGSSTGPTVSQHSTFITTSLPQPNLDFRAVSTLPTTGC